MIPFHFRPQLLHSTYYGHMEDSRHNDVTMHIMDASNGEPLVVRATDIDTGDNGRLSFQIVDEEEYFTVDADTGSVRRKGRVPRKDKLQEYNFKVRFYVKIIYRS